MFFVFYFFFFFFKQKTAYEMRISDWSSDVCSSDLWSDGRMNRVFVADLPAAKATAVGDATLVGADVPGDVPSKPFGDSSEYAWAPDGKSLMLSARKSERTEPWSTTFDLSQFRADGSGAARTHTKATKARATRPVLA